MEAATKRHEGWFPVPEEGLRCIERTFDTESDRRKAKAAFVALLRIANLCGAPSFQRSIGSIARDMDYSPRHAAEAIGLLITAGLCRMEHNCVPDSNFRAPSTYILVQKEQKVRTLEQIVSALPPTGENLEGTNSSKNSPNNAPITTKNRRVASSAAQTKPRTLNLPDEDWLKELESNPVYEGINIRQLLGKMQVWCREKRKHPTRSRFINWLNREEKPIAPPPVKESRFTW